MQFFIIMALGVFAFNTNVHAAGDLVVTFSNTPLFNIQNMLPGDEETATITVENIGASTLQIAAQGLKTTETGNISSVLDFVIAEDSTDVYGGSSPTGPKTLADFFAESVDPLFIPLLSLPPLSETTYTAKATFDATAGNEFQNASVVFDIIIGADSTGPTAPAECSDIDFDGDPIIGTAGNDMLNGTLGNDLIFGLEGSDFIRGLGGNDCIVGGEGSDVIRAGSGEDVIIGSEGNDALYGQNGNDIVLGMEGHDVLFGNNGDDNLVGHGGMDIGFGGPGIDSCSAEFVFFCELP